MNETKNKLTEKEIKLIEETEAFMEEVYSDSEVADAEPLPDLRDKVFAEIRAREAAKREAEVKVEKLDVEEEEAKAEKLSAEEKKPEAEKLTVEEKELIYLGRIYKKRRKLYRVLVVAAVLVMAMAFGITSIGGPEKVFERIKYVFSTIDQTNVDSDHEDVARTSGLDEEEAYREIEETFGFAPVELLYLPENVIFLDAKIGEEIQGAHLSYGINQNVKIAYFIRPNYRVSSYGKDIEDEFLEEYIEENEYTTIYIRKYLVEKNEERWSVQFEYKETLYSLSITESSKDEVKKIVENLFFL